MNIADFLHCLHLLVSLLSMCFWESEQTKLKARDMENSGHWDCTAFSWYSQEAYFTSFFTSLSWLSAHVPARYVGNGSSISQPGCSLKAGVVSPCLLRAPQALVHCSLPWDAPSPGGDSVPPRTPARLGKCHPHRHSLRSLSAQDLSFKWMSPHSQKDSPQAVTRSPVQLSVLFISWVNKLIPAKASHFSNHCVNARSYICPNWQSCWHPTSIILDGMLTASSLF